jgi:hypothetical protein
MPRRILFLVCLVSIGVGALALLLRPQTNLLAGSGLADSDAAALRKVVPPQPKEDLFDQIPWQTSIWDARKLAAKEGKPILLWEMDGHPLGCG